MKKYLNLLRYELKSILRDRMNAFMFIYPVIMLIMSIYLFPFIFGRPDLQNSSIEITMVLIIVMLLGFGYVIGGALLGFSLLDNKDEDTLQTIAVTPVGKSGYIKFKLIYTYVISIVSTIIILSGIKIFALDAYALEIEVGLSIKLFNYITHFEIFIYALSSSLLVPTLGLFISGLAKNKVEGFAYMKSSGMLMLIPMFVLLEAFKGPKQYILGIFPNFWATQGVLVKILPGLNLVSGDYNLNFYLYMLVGAAVSIFYSVLAYRFFIKRAIK
jgi:fluoroquinolone transport system permease protein